MAEDANSTEKKLSMYREGLNEALTQKTDNEELRDFFGDLSEALTHLAFAEGTIANANDEELKKLIAQDAKIVSKIIDSGLVNSIYSGKAIPTIMASFLNEKEKLPSAHPEKSAAQHLDKTPKQNTLPLKQ
jgi:hypothetical protein